jgi:type II secretory pathway component PulF
LLYTPPPPQVVPIVLNAEVVMLATWKISRSFRTTTSSSSFLVANPPVSYLCRLSIYVSYFRTLIIMLNNGYVLDSVDVLDILM